MWIPILILIAVIFLLRNISASHKAAAIPVVKKSVVSSPMPTGGDSFCSGKTFVAGVPEPSMHCCHILERNPLPIHVVLPVDPPPISILQPKKPVLPIRQSGAGGGGLPIRRATFPATRNCTL